MSARKLLSAIVVALVAGVGAWHVLHADDTQAAAGPASERVPHGTLSAGAARDALRTIPVAAPDTMAGYDRDCGRGHGCVFGPAWSDDVDTRGGHNGCDTRNDVLRRDLRPGTIRLKPGTGDCKVLAGVLDDPYTGQEIRFTSEHPTEVQLDHVVSLAEAWRSGARTWHPERRQVFANDPVNLLAVDGPTNQTKSDQPLNEWKPSAGYLCSIARINVTVHEKYGLTISAAKHAAVRSALASCPALTDATTPEEAR